MSDESGEEKPLPPRDPRVAGLDRPKFSHTAREVLDMFADKSLAANPMISKNTALSSGHGLAPPTGLGQNNGDPLKMELEKVENAGYSMRKSAKKDESYSEHIEKVSKMYDTYSGKAEHLGDSRKKGLLTKK